jgi:hypothetical protein
MGPIAYSIPWLRWLSTSASGRSRFDKLFSFDLLLLQFALFVVLSRGVVLQGALEDGHVQVQLLLLGVELDHRQRRMPATIRRPGIKLKNVQLSIFLTKSYMMRNYCLHELPTFIFNLPEINLFFFKTI